MTQEIKKIIQDLLEKEDNLSYEEALQKAIETYKITAKNRHPASEIRAIGEAILDLDTRDKQSVKVIKFNGQTIQLKDGGVAEFAQSGSVDTYGISIASDIDSTKERVLKKGSAFPVKLRYSAIKITTIGETINYRDVPGTMTITRQMKGSSLVETVYTEKGIVSEPRDSSAYNVNLADLAQYCRTGSQTINVTFTTQYTAQGTTQNVTGSVVFNMNVIDLSVKSTQDFLNPLNGNGGQFPSTKFNLSGSVKKYLHVEISGSTQLKTYSNVIELGTEEGAYNLPSIQDTALIGLTNHGVHTVKTWLTCDDGSGHVGSDQYPDGITSDVSIARFMVINDNATQQQLDRVYLLMQETLSKCDNYTQAHLTDFGIWKSRVGNSMAADEGTHDIKIIVTDYSETDTGYTQTYGELNFIGAVCLTKYEADCMIEIESDDETATQFSAYMRILRSTESGYENMISTSGLLATSFVGIEVRNSADYAPSSGATFYMNPKSRSNNESEWDQIRNARSNNSIVTTVSNVSRTHSMWQKDKNGIGVLRVLAGETIEITGEDADAFFALYGNGKSDVSIEIDYKVSNITNNDDPIISMTEDYGGQKLGLELRPQEFRCTCKGSQDTVAQTTRLRENERTNIIVTINHQVDSKDDDLYRYKLDTIDSKFSYKTLSLCRTYINGKCNNAFIYSTENKVWQNTEHGTRFVIGQAGTDIDIYAIRIYPEALTSQQIKQNIIASKTSSAEKDTIVAENKIVDSKGLVKKNLVENNLKRNTITLHSEQEQWKGVETVKQKCYIEMHIYDAETGEELLDRGGYIGKYAYEAYLQDKLNGKKALEEKSQGSTANTYFMHNWQVKVGDITFTVVISVTKLHADFGWAVADSNFTVDEAGNITTQAKYPLFYNGEQIQGTAYAAMPAEQKSECTIEVPDGWFDWNGNYHGQCWKPSANGAKAQKLCNKINYASTMVSHKMGMTALYNDVMRIILSNKNMLPKSHVADNAARFAVEEQPFFYFHQSDENGDAVFHGFGTFGSAKADKPTWGYKKSYKHMCMFEGADNNVPLADFRVPFDDDIHGYYDSAKGDWSWALNNRTNNKADELQLDFDLGLKRSDKEEGLVEPIDTDAPCADITAHLKTFCNLFYTHNTRLNYWQGTIANLRSAYNNLSVIEKRKMETETYWCTADFRLYRFNFTTLEWVDAGVWIDGANGTGRYQAGVRDLSQDSMTKSAYDAWTAGGTRDYKILNRLFCTAIADHFASIAPDYICVDSFLTHYNLINALGGGTDNCSKNTYFVLCLVTINGEDVWRWYWFTDDVDTIFATDNNGAQTKLWWIFRFSDKQDVTNGYKSSTDYEGNGSVMFNLCEDAYDDNLTREDGVSGTKDTKLQLNMSSILSAMQSLVSSEDVIVGHVSESSLMACWHKYFLQYSVYFPIVAYNETGRIRYEYPEAWGYRSMGKGERNIAPILQHLGDQRECEIDFLEKRSILFSQYACWGDAAAATGAIGVSDASAAVSAKGDSTLGQMILDFQLKSDRPFYATGASGNSLINPHVRVMPGQTYDFQVSTDGDQGCGLRCANYYTELGNFGNARVSTQQITINSGHLRKLDLSSSDPLAFKTNGISLSTPNIESFRFGCPGYQSSFNLEDCLRLKSIDIQGSGVNMVTLPKDTHLETIVYNDKILDVTLVQLPYLRSFSAQDYKALMSTSVGSDLTIVDTLSLIKEIYSDKTQAGATPLSSFDMQGVSWGTKAEGTGLSNTIMLWLTNVASSILTGTVNITDSVDGDSKLAYINKYGDVDSESNDLYMTYTNRQVTKVSITGPSSIKEVGTYQFSAQFSPSTANTFKSVVWSVQTNRFCTINNKTGLLTVTEVASELIEQPVVEVKATVTMINGSAMEATMNVRLYNRIPKVGDFAYANGEFSDDLNDGEVVGWVYKVTKYADLPAYVRNEYLKDADIKAKYEAGQQLYEVLVQSKSDISYKTSDGATTFSSTPWGIYPNDATNGLTSAELDAVAAATGIAKGNVTDLANLNNYGTTGLRNSAGTSYGDNYIKDYNAYDDTTDDGFMQYSDSYAVGRWDGKASTDIIVQQAEEMLNDYVGDGTMVGSDGKTIWGYISADHVVPENLTELADLLIALAKLGGANRWRELAYPAAMSCHLFEPVVTGTLHDGFKRGNWYLPSAGDWTRLYIYFRNSRANTPQDSGTPTASYNDIDNASRAREITEARRPWFANMLRRAQIAGKTCPIEMLTQSHSWCSTESSSNLAWLVYPTNGNVGGNGKYYSHVVRPVAAFCFIL